MVLQFRWYGWHAKFVQLYQGSVAFKVHFIRIYFLSVEQLVCMEWYRSQFFRHTAGRNPNLISLQKISFYAFIMRKLHAFRLSNLLRLLVDRWFELHCSRAVEFLRLWYQKYFRLLGFIDSGCWNHIAGIHFNALVLLSYVKFICTLTPVIIFLLFLKNLKMLTLLCIACYD